MMTYWFSYDPASGSGIGKGVSALPLERVAENEPGRAFVEIAPEQYRAIDRADHFRVDSQGALKPKARLALTASAPSAPADGKSAITISWAAPEPLNVIVNMKSAGAHRDGVELTSAAPGRFSVHLMDARYFSDRVVVAFE